MSELNHELGIIALESCKELGDAINKYIQDNRNCTESFLIPVEEIRFSNGEGKIKISETVRAKDIYILCDVGNYSCTYKMFGIENHKGPDEHFQDIKRTVAAIRGKAARITVIMPLLYESRQHRRKGRESLDCALALQELERLGVDEIITFDVHDPNIQNAIPLLSFENIYPTYDIVKAIVSNEKSLGLDKESLLVISPDTGAMDRAIYYSSVLGVDVGLFYKRRDHSTIVNGKNPIVQHEYVGREVSGKDVLIVDDMIASGESVLDIAKELKKRNARNVYVAATFAFFTEGLEKFAKAYEDGLISRIYSTNLTYIPESLQNEPWFIGVDLSQLCARIINRLNHGRSIAKYMDATRIIHSLLNK
ncbi:phosphoribosylpyrophosphate synthetase [Clostridium beijerinckii]|uniref:ribose-phosphate diphosphokinase n=2 Tax=Clostridium beijerinckii TaxID=1520 RepID=A0AAE5LQM1_CLOBE|nr:ribose-phosphate pyrophosphokinase [Clostridium beijerinckii]NRZ26939.1 ribose-phosphate pyrophosphokinase [Clostridium beijerinckii]NSB14960.1 ribose-phosphate pyrophosphokinase [Clostridium beijerinckii]NYB97265.1 ribose-phosphate pyrophosphokinase [Clostridium beijerinckii]OOM19562.1 ribose-phosphate pyrophosphokinase [Clostridium beijerinckii]OOM22019.1 ribose-phosphate pyrophosphokinase [Clostridium beijerinckii]